MTTSVQRQNILGGLVVVDTADFVPTTAWPELEAAREHHERALEEHRSVQAKRQKARDEERQLQEHLAAVQQAKQESENDARQALKEAAGEAVRAVAENGETWLAQIASERAEALAERDALLAQAAEAEARSHKHDGVEAWLLKAQSSVPQPFGSLEPAAVAS